MRKIKSLKLKGKLLMFVTVLLIVVILLLSAISFISLQSAYDLAVTETKQDFDTKIKTAVDNVVGMLDAQYQRYLDGEITEQEALETSKSIVRNTRYDNGDGYFWADMADGLCVIHTNSEYEGQMRYNESDSRGTHYIQNIIAVGDNKDGGFTEFYFKKLNEDKEYQKRAYTKKFESYGWYISTGNYYDNINAAIDSIQTRKLYAELIFLAVSIVLAVFGIAAMYSGAKRLVGPIEVVTNRLHLLANGDAHTPPAPVTKTKDELQTLSEASDKLILQMRDIIGDITMHLTEISSGNMTMTVTGNYIGDFIPIKESLIQIYASLNNTLSTVYATAEQVKAESVHVSGASQELASNATEQASAIEQISATAADVLESANKNAENADNSAQDIKNAYESMNLSNAQMNNLLTAMHNINESSDKIREIIKLVENIAMQTNLLAVNASIEAAHAGAAGKGFSVIASEISRLAEQSAAAANETESLIIESVDAVSEGVSIAKSTAENIESTLEIMDTSRASVVGIQEASASQADYMLQINNAIEQISASIQTNSATAEESSASSEELSAQSDLLYQELVKFKLTE